MPCAPVYGAGPGAYTGGRDTSCPADTTENEACRFPRMRSRAERRLLRKYTHTRGPAGRGPPSCMYPQPFRNLCAASFPRGLNAGVLRARPAVLVFGANVQFRGSPRRDWVVNRRLPLPDPGALTPCLPLWRGAAAPSGWCRFCCSPCAPSALSRSPTFVTRPASDHARRHPRPPRSTVPRTARTQARRPRPHPLPQPRQPQPPRRRLHLRPHLPHPPPRLSFRRPHRHRPRHPQLLARLRLGDKPRFRVAPQQ